MMSKLLYLQRYMRGILMIMDCRRHNGLFGSLRQSEVLMMIEIVLGVGFIF
jgi:hypothetical protein